MDAWLDGESAWTAWPLPVARRAFAEGRGGVALQYVWPVLTASGEGARLLFFPVRRAGQPQGVILHGPVLCVKATHSVPRTLSTNLGQSEQYASILLKKYAAGP
jgi:hypothetical protein